jgi:hypothetical protein
MVTVLDPGGQLISEPDSQHTFARSDLAVSTISKEAKQCEFLHFFLFYRMFKRICTCGGVEAQNWGIVGLHSVPDSPERRSDIYWTETQIIL